MLYLGPATSFSKTGAFKSTPNATSDPTHTLLLSIALLAHQLALDTLLFPNREIPTEPFENDICTFFHA